MQAQKFTQVTVILDETTQTKRMRFVRICSDLGSPQQDIVSNALQCSLNLTLTR